MWLSLSRGLTNRVATHEATPVETHEATLVEPHEAALVATPEAAKERWKRLHAPALRSNRTKTRLAPRQGARYRAASLRVWRNW